ncbi:MAG: hypothetical protein ACKOTB_03465 [Planctomycetia bacterium]
MNILDTVRSKVAWVVILLVATASGPGAEPLLASPARRLARRGVVVVPPAAAVVVPAPLVVPALPPVAVPPLGWPLRRPLVPPFAPPFPPPFPPFAAVVAIRPVPARTAVAVPVVPAPAAPSQPAPSAAPGTVQPPPAAAEEIPTPQPAASSTARPAPVDRPLAERPPSEVAFTQEWFARHPEAWRPDGVADVWQVADLATVAGWLEAAAGGGAKGDRETGGAATQAKGSDVGSDGLRSVLVLPAEPADRVVEQGGWLALGVFAVVTPGDRATAATSHSMQQLAVDREGTIRGNFVDALSGTVHPIRGSIDPATLTATWSVGSGGGRFTAPIASFASEPHAVAMTVGGVTHDMALARLRP